MNVGSLFVALGFKVVDKGAKEFDNKIQSVTKNMAKMAAAAVAAIYAVDRFVSSTSRASIALGNFALQTGLSAQKLQQWQFAATMANTAMSADEATASITGLSQALMEIRMGQGNPEAFRWLGVNPMGKDVFQVLEELSRTVKDLDPAFASMMLNQIGLSEEWVNVLTQGEDALREMFDKAPQRSNAYIKTMQEIGKLSKEFRLNMSLFFERIVVRGMPLIRSFYSFVERGMRSLSGIVEMMFRVGEAMHNLWVSMPEGLRLLITLIAMLRAPLVALLLILDDFATWMQGGDSLFGGIYEFVKKISSELKPLMSWMSDVLDKALLIDSYARKARNKFVSDSIDVGKGVWGMYRAQGNVAPDQYAKEREELERWMNRDSSDDDFSVNQRKNEYIAPNGYSHPIPPPPPPPPPPPLPPSVNQSNTINVYGSDPEATANAVINQSQRAINHAYADMKGGMNR